MLPLITAFLPFLFGAVLGFSPVKTVKSKKGLFSVTAGASALTLVFAALTAALGGEIALFPLAKGFPLFFRADGAAKLFGVLAAAIWLPAVVYSRSYMREEDCKAEKRFDAFLLLSLGALLGVAYAGNLLTLYLFFESLTLLSLPLVLHNRTEEAIRAGKKYLFYSVCGAFLALPCICAVCLWAGKGRQLCSRGNPRRGKAGGKRTDPSRPRFSRHTRLRCKGGNVSPACMAYRRTSCLPGAGVRAALRTHCKGGHFRCHAPCLRGGGN